MKKSDSAKNLFSKNLSLLVLCAVLASLSVVLGKFLAINVTNSLRISFESLPILFAGLFLGPLYGALVGTVADLVGCLIVGYSINPIITLGAATIGIISGIFSKSQKLGKTKKIFFGVFSAHIIGSMIIKTVGLYVYYSTPIGILALRLPIYILTASLESYVLYLISKKNVMKF